MTDVELARFRLAIKKSILHYLCDDWNNHKQGKAHKENQAIFDKESGNAIWCETDLEMVMGKVVKGIWSVNIEDISNDVCEWKLDGDNLMTSCGDYFNLYDNCTEKFNYCPKCGKKIKVVK